MWGGMKKSGWGVSWTASELSASGDNCSPGRGGMAQNGRTRAEHFVAKWMVAEEVRAGLRHAVVCPNVMGRTKDRIAQSKRARIGSLALVV